MESYLYVWCILRKVYPTASLGTWGWQKKITPKPWTGQWWWSAMGCPAAPLCTFMLCHLPSHARDLLCTAFFSAISSIILWDNGDHLCRIGKGLWRTAALELQNPRCQRDFSHSVYPNQPSCLRTARDTSNLYEKTHQLNTKSSCLHMATLDTAVLYSK